MSSYDEKKATKVHLSNEVSKVSILVSAKLDLELKKENLKKTKEPYDQKFLHDQDFKKCLVENLMNIYQECIRITPDSEESWGETIKDGLKQTVKAVRNISIGSGTGALAGTFFNKKEMNGAAIGGTMALLYTLWQIENEQEAKQHAKTFLKIVADIKNDNAKIEKRMEDIAGTLQTRFQAGIHHLHSGEEGVEMLANFFSMVIARDLPNKIKNFSGSITTIKLLRIIHSIAIPQKKDDPIYKNFWYYRKPRLKTIDFKKNWTIQGLLMRSPIILKERSNHFKYYLIDGQLKKDNRADKYPPQLLFMKRPQCYIAVFDEKITKTQIEKLFIMGHTIDMEKKSYNEANKRYQKGHLTPEPKKN